MVRRAGSRGHLAKARRRVPGAPTLRPKVRYRRHSTKTRKSRPNARGTPTAGQGRVRRHPDTVLMRQDSYQCFPNAEIPKQKTAREHPRCPEVRAAKNAGRTEALRMHRNQTDDQRKPRRPVQSGPEGGGPPPGGTPTDRWKGWAVAPKSRRGERVGVLSQHGPSALWGRFVCYCVSTLPLAPAHG